MVASCYNRDRTWLCVYCWCQTPQGVVSPRGETTPWGVWHQHYTHDHAWSLKHMTVGRIATTHTWALLQSNALSYTVQDYRAHNRHILTAVYVKTSLSLHTQRSWLQSNQHVCLVPGGCFTNISRALQLITWKYTIPEITFMVRNSSSNYVRVPKACLSAQMQIFSL